MSGFSRLHSVRAACRMRNDKSSPVEECEIPVFCTWELRDAFGGRG